MVTMSDALQVLAKAIAAGSATSDTVMLAAMRGVFGERYHKRSAPYLDHERPPFIRNAYGKGGSETDHVAYAGFINPENPPSGPYGGTSLVWFPRDEGCLIDFGIGTRGLSPELSRDQTIASASLVCAAIWSARAFPLPGRARIPLCGSVADQRQTCILVLQPG